MNIMLWKKVPTRNNPAHPASLIFLLGCLLVTFSSQLHSNFTGLQAFLGFFAALSTEALGPSYQWADVPLLSKSIVLVILCPLPYLLIAWSFRKHFVDWLTFFLVAALIGCAIWSYYIFVEKLPIFVLLSICVYAIPVWLFVQTFGGSDVDWLPDWLTSLLITVWSGFFLWSYLLAESIDGW